MQVSHVQDRVTHAVIGGKQSIEFGISNSAEFFNILSSTLYKDQILAVVREVLCNAWDAHIEAGCTDRPVQITLDRDIFSIKDFGKGIHHEDMGLIYGTYGNSTKKNDGMQTGGFGLGCKAPFAYTGHFEVTSSHAGIKTIYNLSKSSAQAMGKPGIIPIASFPTEETGLTVSIRIKSSDYHRFVSLITRIVCNGEMNMTLNGKQLDTLGFDASNGNYLITQQKDILDDNSRIMVRYGNVIYPVDQCAELEVGYSKIVEHLNTLTIRRYSYYYVIFQAPPNSIAVTPSREALSMQEHTLNTLNTLFTGFLTTLSREFPTVCDTYAETVTNTAVSENKLGELLKRDAALPSLHEKDEPLNIVDLGMLAKVYMRNNYPNGLEYRKADITRRLNLMVKQNMLDRGKVQTFLLALNDVHVPYERDAWSHPRTEKSSWLQRRVVAPLLTKLSKAGLDSDKLYICDAEDANSVRSAPRSPLVPATKVKPRHLLATLPYLRNIIVITGKRTDILDSAYDHDDFIGLGRYAGFMVYHVGRKAGEVDAVRNFFVASGMRVIDLTIEQAKKRIIDKSFATSRKPVKKGLVTCSHLLEKGTFDTWRLQYADAPRIMAPEFVILINDRVQSSRYNLTGWNRDRSIQLIKLFGDKGGITTNTRAQQKWLAQGAKDFNDYVLEKVCAYILFNPRIEQYWSLSHEPATKDASFGISSTLLDLLYSTPSMAKEFNLVTNLTEEDKLYLSLWEGLKRRYGYDNAEYFKVVEWLNGIPINSACSTLMTKLINNPLLEIFSYQELQRLINNPNNPVHANKARDILIAAINN